MRARCVGVVVACLLLAGCATPGLRGPGSDAPGGGAGSPLDDLAAVDPVELINLWRVHDAEGEADPTWLRLDRGSYQLWRGCGFLEGGWNAADEALFIASQPFSMTGGCMEDGAWPTLPWLAGARAVQQHGDGWTLLAADGQKVATLVVDGAPEPIADAATYLAEPPDVTDAVRQSFSEPAPLPDHLVAPSIDRLLGRWASTGGARNDPHVVLDADLTWSGSDGCNGASGAWATGADGRFLATTGISTAIGCDGAPVPSWVGSAQRVGLDGEVLVLLDRDGAELGRLVRG